ncbi:hypothetical protein GGR50DRAFT_699864 [Xylaria sp. CBS 124048]|nr:hypothetical protein GGR50DRAFT_699864 [Xylaria sp. CBS 124048]
MSDKCNTNGRTNGVNNEDKKLVLCFDGTGNTFSGSNADTNVVKLLNKLDRHDPHQFHYYQSGFLLLLLIDHLPFPPLRFTPIVDKKSSHPAGIGTYDINEKSVNKSWFGELRSSLAMTIDEGIGNTFDAHVMAGYRFLMKFYDTRAKSGITQKKDTKIYMFGFSRGAFTAKFLARMINTVGLLCKGNEEMIPFAYRLYQRYLAGEVEDFTAMQIHAHRHAHMHAHDVPTDTEGSSETDDDSAEETNPMLEDNERGDHMPHGFKFERAHNEVTAFSNTFCRKERVKVECGDHGEIEEERNIKVYFLGIWDCVNSVAPLERHTPVPVPVKGTARYVRHAVSVDERRVKFKPALLSQDIRATDAYEDKEDLKEVWFPGCHGDVGGGWPAENTVDENEKPVTRTIWQGIKSIFRTSRAKEASKDVRADPFQMSDVPLAWMIRELELVGLQDPAAAIRFSKHLGGFKRAYQKKKHQALTGMIHDSLVVGRGTSFFRVVFWNFMEYLPFITRWELEKNVWVHTRFPLNAGNSRDIPKDAVLHESLIWRLKNDEKYRPTNNHGGRLLPCLKHKNVVAQVKEVENAGIHVFGVPDPDHRTYVFADQDS